VRQLPATGLAWHPRLGPARHTAHLDTTGPGGTWAESPRITVRSGSCTGGRDARPVLIAVRDQAIKTGRQRAKG